MYRTGTYLRDSTGKWTIEHKDEQIPWIPIDPADPVNLDEYPRFKHAQVLTVTLERGDILYLPALWFHRVSQTASCDPRSPLAVAVNVSSLKHTMRCGRNDG